MRTAPVTTILGLAAAAAVALALSTSLLHLKRKSNVLLITIDTLRADHLSCYGSTDVYTPVIDTLAAHAVLFEQAYADVTWTTPSMASVMTGLYAPKHGVRTSYQRLRQSVTTVAEYLRQAGFETGAIVASFPLDSIFGLDQGFQTYDDTFTAPLSIDPEHPPSQRSVERVPSRFSDDTQEMMAMLFDKATHDAYRPDNEVTDAAIRWLTTRHRHEPFFFWVHYFGPHEKPQTTSDVYEERRRQLAQYNPDVEMSDHEVGRLLKVIRDLGFMDRTAIILHADHGQSLLEHDYFGHGRDIYDPSQRVPLIVRPSGGLATGMRVTRMVRNLDIMPTILALEGIEPRTTIDGRSLLPALTSSAIDVPEEIYVETYLSANFLFGEIIDPVNDVRLGYRRLGIRTSQWKYVVNDPAPFADVLNAPPITDEVRRKYYSEELYDLASDPGELRNVIASHRSLAAAFLEHVWEVQPRAAPTPEALPIGGTTRERLKSLGYVD
ncbi:MAG: sulfatase [Deltaproteobacteria bacterium]|nr:sulfatase [Deltaproteobacteria bacterium]